MISGFLRVDADLLEAICRLGLPALIVGDPDQAIYGFRTNSVPAAARLFTRAPVITLTGNWRSSATICRLAATLRPDRTRPADVALADHHDSRLPVFLLPRDEAADSDAFAALAADAGIAARDRFVLAYASQTLSGAVASARRPPHNRTEALLWALARLIQQWTAAPGGAGTAAPDTDEAMRVLYVAVTRARQLVALALPPQHIPTVARMLISNGVAVKTVG